jgi:crotonobetainyl-CoA:carnitine CoA-transferase CaiB-like acyl-CoA transferase
MLAEWFVRHDSKDILELFDRSHVVAGLVYDVRDIFEDPQYAARNNIVDVPDIDFGTVRMQGVVPKFSRTPGTVRKSGGALGQDNDAVYREQLGLSRAELSELEAEGVI